MKKVFVTFLLLGVFFCVKSANDDPQQQIPITLTVSYTDPSIGIRPGTPKYPVEPPYVTYLDHTLYIWSQHNGYTLTLLDDNDTVVYQSYVAPGVQYAVLPSTLSGSYTLVLSDDTYMFTGMLELE
jgi:hypothetical protein